MHKRLAILGSTGSIGTQTLGIISRYPELFTVSALTAGSNVGLLIEQARLYRPERVVIGNEAFYGAVRDGLADLDIEVMAGQKAIEEVASSDGADTVVAAMVGFAGLRPTAAAVAAGKVVALANKETLVVAGELIVNTATITGSRLLPVDSEHSAIMQCIIGEQQNSVERIILTASGGPFRNTGADRLAKVSPLEALRHPNWSMGSKITVDSATLMNKGLEVIEAHWLFGIEAEKIDVIVHPQSIIHSLVQFTDGSLKAQLGVPDMRLPIIYALTFPERVVTELPRPSLAEIGSLTFEAPDTIRFRCLPLARMAIKSGGNMPCALNAANEVAVAAFLQEKIGFNDIAATVEHTMEYTTINNEPSMDVYEETDLKSRGIAMEYINKLRKK
ncbi:MAG: 1-deoxy-D-xylulose-5-phosphate reductoisomerase [Bacteroidales bacterium]|jgi:1-deoxy-D-xylulose-5-phosphate reductoisomerase|nr:1-deoxy-D-xylulose-5-phosphate reductoisomerase [Bacteroidales bacterium]